MLGHCSHTYLHQPGIWSRRPKNGITLADGFSLLEMLVAMAVLLVLMSIIFQVTQLASKAWQQSAQHSNMMQEARTAFERVTRNISQATLNTYYDYAPDANEPEYYIRKSDLQFLSGFGPAPGSGPSQPFIQGQITHAVFFQAPLGTTLTSSTYANLNSLLNACGYYLTYGKDPLRPNFLATFSNAPQDESRYRLMEFLQPSENLGVYALDGIPSATGATTPPWISNGLSSTTPVTVRPLASNIVALIIMPEQSTPRGTNGNTTPLTSNNTYNYDTAQNATTVPQPRTANQLPPIVRVVMVAIDEISGIRLASAYGTAPPDLGQSQLFQNPTELDADLLKFENVLNAANGNIVKNKIKLNYKIFQTDVAIREAKWSN